MRNAGWPVSSIPSPKSARNPAPPRWLDPWLPTVLVGTAAAAPAVWWISGGVTDSPFNGPDYLIRPVSISDSAQTTIGSIATTLAIAAVGQLAWLVWSRRWSGRWVGVVGPLFTLSAFVGYAYYWCTYPVIGANIGGGLLIFANIPMSLITVGITALSAWPRKRPQSAGP